jgi:hypothetical protein
MRQKPIPGLQVAQQCGPKQPLFASDAKSRNSVTRNKVADGVAQAGQQLNVLVAVEVRRLESVIAQKLDLRRQLGPERPLERRPAAMQLTEQGANPAEGARFVEQLRWILSGERVALGQIQMDAKLECGGRLVKTPAGLERWQSAGGSLWFQGPPDTKCSFRIGRVSQQRRARQQAATEALDDPVSDRPVHPEIVGVEDDGADREHASRPLRASRSNCQRFTSL